MSSDGFAFTNLIDTPHWNDAAWLGVAFGVDPSGQQPPFMGVLFQNEAAGREIFDDWVHRFGSSDEFDEIRVAIIEGNIPGKDAGYSVTIGSDIEGITERAKQEHQEVDARYIATVTRYHRMNPQPGSPFLPGFKNAYKQIGEYLLLPDFGSQTQPQPDFGLAIRKRKILFRDVADVDDKDIDSVIFN
ncbi:MAG: hypothetical protein GXP26_02135 [Planctomycetes bacterium]|nr:hypothetical protein [Planctomycetota bacterium]